MMNKKLFVILVVGVLVLLTIVLIFVRRGQIEDEPEIVVTDEPSPGMEDAIVEKSNFRILLPQGWTDHGGPEEFVAIIGGDESSYLAGEWAEVRAISFPKMDQTFDEHLAAFLRDLKTEIENSDGASVLVREEEMTISGQPAHYIQIESSGETEEGPIISGLRLIEGEEDVLYLVTIAPSPRWESYEDVFERIVESFEIK